MSVTEEASKAPKLELTIDQIVIGTLRNALEFNAQIIELASQVVAMDPSGHNKSTYRRITSSFEDANRKYVAKLDASNKQIIEQFLSKNEEK
jgi:hypothetical protein